MATAGGGATTAAIRALNARIRSNKVLSYICSTHFWGPVSNFGIPAAAVMDLGKDPERISPRFTATLALYSAVFMRYALAIRPKNYLIFAMHFTNFNAQVALFTRWYRFAHPSQEGTMAQNKQENDTAVTPTS